MAISQHDLKTRAKFHSDQVQSPSPEHQKISLHFVSSQPIFLIFEGNLSRKMCLLQNGDMVTMADSPTPLTLIALISAAVVRWWGSWGIH